MKSEVEITVENAPFDASAISGITIIHGINAIPIARVSLSAPYIQTTSGKEFICNPDKFKKRDSPAVFTIKTKTGCMKFTGFFDGMSVQQSPGSLEYSAIFKNQFQRMLEIFPKFCGVMPTSFNPFCAVNDTTVSTGHPELVYPAFKLAGKSVDTNQSIGDFIVDLFKVMIQSQVLYYNNMQSTPAITIASLLGNGKYQDNLEQAEQLIGATVTDFVSVNHISAAYCASGLMNLLMGDKIGNLWDLLLECIETIGCSVVVGDTKIYIVPKANYLKGPDVAKPQRQESTPDLANIAYPADYNNFVVNDIGYANIKACFITAVDNILLTNMATDAMAGNYLGVYPTPDAPSELDNADDGSSGILIFRLEDTMLNGMMTYFTMNNVVQERLATANPYAGSVAENVDAVQKILQQSIDIAAEANKKQKTIMNQFAKIKFLEQKYTGRTGSLTSVFNPYWVPGSTGTVYSRFPGLFYQFFVTSVVHTISVHAPGTGTAITSISFDSVRSAANIGDVPGVVNVDLFEYDVDKMTNFQYKWLTDIGARKA
jgi:hypothetical protein